jgi:phospholipid/cholesterol/gamma-HCH transport system substrate-binding protein
MITRRRLTVAAVVALTMVVVGGLAYVLGDKFLGTKTITANFTSATGVYPGDDVRVLGVKVGTINAIQPVGSQVKIVMKIDHDVPIPADAKAVIVAQNLVSARYVQLAPAYRPGGPVMSDGAQIPVERTAVPVEWDDVKDQLTRMATEFGPKSDVSGTSVGRFIDSADNALNGNGEKLRHTLAELSGAGRILADGSGNISDTVKNLQIFVSALRDSTQQIASFENRLATVTTVVDDSRSDLDAALRDLSVAVGDVQRFIAGSRDQTSEQIQRLANVTQNLVDHRIDLENVLHAAATGIANGYNVYNPDTGTPVGSIVLNNYSNPVYTFCGMIGAVENITAPETAKLCSEYLGPALRLLNINYIPIPTNFYLRKSASPANLIYTDPALIPGGAGPTPGPPETPPAISAYTGAGDVPPPAGYGQPPMAPPGLYAPDHLPAFPSPGLYPRAPLPGPPRSIGDILLPPPPPSAGNSPPGPLPAEAGTPQSAGGTR